MKKELASVFLTILLIAASTHAYVLSSLQSPLQDALFNAGLKMSIELSTLEEAKDAIYDTLIDQLNHFEIQDINFPKGYAKNMTLHVISDASKVDFSNDVAKNAVKFTCNSCLSLNFAAGSFSIKIMPMVTAKGSAVAEMKNVSVSFGISFTAKTLADGRVVPNVETVDINVDIPKNEVKITLKGDLVTKFASILEKLFKGTVVGMIEDKITTVLKDTIPAQVNAFVDATDGFLPLTMINPNWTNWVLDFEIPEAFVVTEVDLGLSMKGFLFDNATGEVEPTTLAPEMPYKEFTHPQTLQIFLSTYSMNGAADSALDFIDAKGWVNSTMSPVPITADLIDIVLPGAKAYYGKNTTFNILASVQKIGNFRVSHATHALSLTTTLNLQFWANTTTGMEQAADITFVDTDVALSILIDQQEVFGALADIIVDQVIVGFCKWGTLNPESIKTKLNVLFEVIAPIANHFLSTMPLKVPSLPPAISKFISLTDLTLDYYDDYLFLGMTPTFKDPDFSLSDFGINWPAVKVDQDYMLGRLFDL